jgi:hypothetical protein
MGTSTAPPTTSDDDAGTSTRRRRNWSSPKRMGAVSSARCPGGNPVTTLR